MALVKVINTLNHAVGVYIPELNFKRTWAKRGAIIKIEKDKLEEMMYDPGFNYMLEQGVLYVEDMEVKKEVGIEPEDATAPTAILLDDKQLKRFWKDMPLSQFKVETKNLKKVQLDSLAEYAIREGGGSIEKANYLSKISGYKILKGIELEN